MIRLLSIGIRQNYILFVAVVKGYKGDWELSFLAEFILERSEGTRITGNRGDREDF